MGRERPASLKKSLHRLHMEFFVQQSKDILRLVIYCVKVISGDCMGQQKPNAVRLHVFVSLERGLDLDGLLHASRQLSLPSAADGYYFAFVYLWSLVEIKMDPSAYPVGILATLATWPSPFSVLHLVTSVLLRVF